MVQTSAGQPAGWDDGVEDLAVNSPANCVYRALGGIVPDEFDGAGLWKAAVFCGNRSACALQPPKASELLDKLYPEGAYWQKVLQYCEAGNLQAVLE